MNRETKFRFFDKNGKKMYQAGVLDFDDKKIYMAGYMGYSQSNFLLENVELMQSTGLKDKNGVEIYEGDILKIPEWLWEDEQEYCVCIYQQENEVCDIIRIWTICKRLIF